MPRQTKANIQKEVSALSLVPAPKRRTQVKQQKPILPKRIQKALPPNHLIPGNPADEQNPKLIKQTFEEPSRQTNFGVPVIKMHPEEEENAMSLDDMLNRRIKEQSDDIQIQGEPLPSQQESSYQKKERIIPNPELPLPPLSQEQVNNTIPQIYEKPFKLLEEGKISSSEFKQLVNEAKIKGKDPSDHTMEKYSHLF